jgi:hypothetical protein
MKKFYAIFNSDSPLRGRTVCIHAEDYMMDTLMTMITIIVWSP